MSKELTLRDRMKQYETVTKNWLTLRTPKVIRLDMKGANSFCKGFEQPFDDLFSRCMMKTAQDLCQQIPGVVFAYTQSDKISLVLNDVTEDDKTESWCDGCVNKIVALSASMATLAFNKAYAEEVSKLHDVELDAIYGPKQWTAAFDSRAFCLPDIWEYDTAGTSKTDFLLKKGPMENVYNGYISVNPNLEAAISDLINGGSSISLMSAGPARMPKTLAALMLGADSVDPSIDEKTLAIKSLVLANGNVTIALTAEAEDPAAGTVFVTDGMVRVTVVVKYADSLDGEWNSVEKYLEKKIEDGTVSEELTFSLEELGLDASKGFFKVEVKQ